jgi:hypothetical protein
MLANIKAKLNVFVNDFNPSISVSIFKKLHFDLLYYV